MSQYFNRDSQVQFFNVSRFLSCCYGNWISSVDLPHIRYKKLTITPKVCITLLRQAQLAPFRTHKPEVTRTKARLHATLPNDRAGAFSKIRSLVTVEIRTCVKRAWGAFGKWGRGETASSSSSAPPPPPLPNRNHCSYQSTLKSCGEGEDLKSVDRPVLYLKEKWLYLHNMCWWMPLGSF